MMYFKLELINREESYNKIFSRSPNVGLMQAIKVRALLELLEYIGVMPLRLGTKVPCRAADEATQSGEAHGA
jgi:hypothetical protein